MPGYTRTIATVVPQEADARARFESRFWAKVERSEWCWLWTACTNANGYGWFSMPGKHGGSRLAHRIAFELVNGPIEPGRGVLHRCDTPACVRPEHLYAGGPSENTSDMWDRGRANREPKRGEASNFAVLSGPAVTEIRALYAAGAASQKELAQQFGVTWQAIASIVHRRTWRHLP